MTVPQDGSRINAAMEQALELVEDGDRRTARSVLAAALAALPDGRDRRQRHVMRPFEDQLAEVRDALREVAHVTLSERALAEQVDVDDLRAEIEALKARIAELERGNPPPALPRQPADMFRAFGEGDVSADVRE